MTVHMYILHYGYSCGGSEKQKTESVAFTGGLDISRRTMDSAVCPSS